jgi:NADH dehydrogenase/NADH:ubiquinone oxidoreductase subunit G
LFDKDTLDTLDSYGSNIRVQTRGDDILRVLPVKNDLINQDWISDKTRFSIDSFSLKKEREFSNSTRDELFSTLLDNLNYDDNEKNLNVQFVVGPHVDVESLNALEKFSSRFGSNGVLICDQNGGLSADWGGSFSMHSGLNGIENSDCLLLVGTSPKTELPLLNARLRSSFLRDNTKIASIGSSIESGFPIPTGGLSLDAFESFLLGSHPFSKEFAQAKNPTIILSSSLFESSNDIYISELLEQFSIISSFSVN